MPEVKLDLDEFVAAAEADTVTSQPWRRPDVIAVIRKGVEMKKTAEFIATFLEKKGIRVSATTVRKAIKDLELKEAQ